jgi:hypothetical protein
MEDNPMDFDILGIISLVVGIALSWQGGVQLKRETARIRRLNEINLMALEQAGIVKLNRDAQGNIVGRIIEMNMHVTSGSVTPTADLQVTRIEKPKNE